MGDKEARTAAPPEGKGGETWILARAQGIALRPVGGLGDQMPGCRACSAKHNREYAKAKTKWAGPGWACFGEAYACTSRIQKSTILVTLPPSENAQLQAQHRDTRQ